MLLSLSRDPGPGDNGYTWLLVLLAAMFLLPAVGGGFLVAWGIRLLVAGSVAKGLFVLLATLLVGYGYYDWLLGLL